MAMHWRQEAACAATDDAAHELTDIEVDEVSLVDRPATGRRFVLFKRIGPLRRAWRLAGGEIANKRSDAGPTEIVAELRKRAEELGSELERLRAENRRIEERMAALEAARPARQSHETDPRRASFWTGVL